MRIRILGLKRKDLVEYHRDVTFNTVYTVQIDEEGCLFFLDDASERNYGCMADIGIYNWERLPELIEDQRNA